VLAHDRAKGSPARLLVVRSSDLVLRILHVTGLDQVLDICPIMHAALASGGQKEAATISR
jgi:hypothetical protein